MALSSSSSWFHNWNPPANLLPDQANTFFHQQEQQQQQLHQQQQLLHQQRTFNNGIWNRDNEEHNGRRPNGASYTMSNFLPFLLTLGMVSPPGQNNVVRTASFPRVPRVSRPKALVRAGARYTEKTGPFKTWYQWKQLDFAYPSEQARLSAIINEEFIPENNLPLGVEVYKERLFISMPKWKPGVPCTLAVLPRIPKESSPKLVPYPSWKWHTTESCDGITSVFRMQADACGRLWVLDSGQIDITIKPKQVCPPALFVFDLKTDNLIFKYDLPEDFILEDSLYSNIVVDIRHNDCEDTHAYLTDVWRFGLVVFSLEKMKSWRIMDHLFYPDPLAAAYRVHDLDFEWTDGIFGIALSPINPLTKDRLIYFHPMSSYREFYTTASVVRNETGWKDIKDAFKVLGESRGKHGHASASSMDRNGILFYNLVSKDAIACWDSRKPYKRTNQGIVAQNDTTLVFPNDLKIDQEQRQSVWIITNRLPLYLYKGLDEEDVNFRIMSAYVDEAIKNTICDPNISNHDTFIPVNDGEDCY